MKKEYYPLLDGMRGVAALSVIAFHLFEAVAFAAGADHQGFFHGFLAVDFFLLLSGFVMGQAYDPEWGKMSVGGFFKRRLVRLHPMVVLGVVIGLIVFICQGGVNWQGESVGWGRVALTVLLSLFLIPSPLKTDIRGNQEMFPLNGPHWSLFFEYIGSILYALLLRRLSTKALKIWVACAALALLSVGLFFPDGSIGVGWSSDPLNMLGGFIRMSFDYPAGLLIARMFREKRPSALGKSTFIICAAVLVGLLCVPYIGRWGVPFQLFCVAVAFPSLIWFAARGTAGKKEGLCKFLGGLSYPIYAVHYPLIYLYIGWINDGVNPFGPFAWCSPAALAVICIALGTVCYLFYDIPVRKYLRKSLNL